MPPKGTGKGAGKRPAKKRPERRGPKPKKVAGPVTMRMRAIDPSARDNVPRTDNSAGALVFGLLLVFAAVAVVAWMYWVRLLAPTPDTKGTPVQIGTVGSGVTNLAITEIPQLTIYGYDTSGRYLIPLQVPLDDDPLRELRDHLNGPAPKKGVDRLLPGDTKLRDLRQEGSMAIVDLEEATFDLLPGESAEHGLLEALTRTVTSVRGIDRVRFMVEGQAVDTTLSGVALDAPWTVQNELNIVAEGSGTTRGRFYFLDSTGEFLVPVTMPFEARDTPLNDKLQRLLEGPPPGQDLRAVIPPQVIFDEFRYDQREGLLQLEFISSDPPQAWGLYHPRQFIQALVLTLREVVPIRKLTVTMNDTDIWAVTTFAGAEEATANVAAFNPLNEHG